MALVSIKDIQTGLVARIRPAELARLSGTSLPTIYRKIKEQQIVAIVDAASGRVYVPCAQALAYIRGERYCHNPQDTGAIAKMERARAGKAK